MDKFKEFQCNVHHILVRWNTVADALGRVCRVKADVQEEILWKAMGQLSNPFLTQAVADF